MKVKGEKLAVDSISRVLLIQLGDIGDVVLTTPTMRALRENLVSSTIFVLVHEPAKGIVENCPWVDGTMSVEKKKRGLRDTIAYHKDFLTALRGERFELTIDLRAGTRGAILSFLSGAGIRIGRYSENGELWRNRLFTHLVRPKNELDQYSSLHSLNILAPLDLNIKDPLPVLEVPLEKEDRALELLRKAKVPLDKPIIALHPFSRWGYKEWPIQNYIRLIDHMGSRYPVCFVITGTPEEKHRAAEITRGSHANAYNLAGRTSISELPGVLKKCSLLIGIDSAAVHIAASVGTPTTTIFGPSSPTNWAPRGTQHQVVSMNLPCVPCREKGCDNSEVSRCLRELGVHEVITPVEKQIRNII
ncbi:MAG: glycosyltransferase family 9 protein [Deltaproteobacteria bacterium]|nr:MAG: glycosyltransferase family 9 protein [Deltaproteobacteria bacterium]